MLTQFQIKMRRLDKTLFLKLDKQKQRYVVYRKDRKNVPREILVIENSGDFCYPNYEHLVKLYKSDLWRNKNLIKEMDEYNDNLDRESNQKIHFLSDEMSKLITRSAYF